MTITWEALAALCALCALVFAATLGFVRMMIHSALSDFEGRFFDRLNGKYIKSELCEVRHHETERRLQALEEA